MKKKKLSNQIFIFLIILIFLIYKEDVSPKNLGTVPLPLAIEEGKLEIAEMLILSNRKSLNQNNKTEPLLTVDHKNITNIRIFQICSYTQVFVSFIDRFMFFTLYCNSKKNLRLISRQVRI